MPDPYRSNKLRNTAAAVGLLTATAIGGQALSRGDGDPQLMDQAPRVETPSTAGSVLPQAELIPPIPDTPRSQPFINPLDLPEAPAETQPIPTEAPVVQQLPKS